MSTHPIKYKNSTGASMPAFGIFRMSTGARETSGELVPTAELYGISDPYSLFVNSALAVADNAYGNCVSVLGGPFWVRYDTSNAPADGDVVGPVNGETFFSEKGLGFLVLFKDSTKELAWCSLLAGQQYWDAELTASLSPASNSKTGASTASAKLLVPNPSSAGNLMDGPTITVTNRSLDASGLNGDYIQVVRIGTEWRPPWIDC